MLIEVLPKVRVTVKMRRAVDKALKDYPLHENRGGGDYGLKGYGEFMRAAVDSYLAKLRGDPDFCPEHQVHAWGEWFLSLDIETQNVLHRIGEGLRHLGDASPEPPERRTAGKGHGSSRGQNRVGSRSR